MNAYLQSRYFLITPYISKVFLTSSNSSSSGWLVGWLVTCLWHIDSCIVKIANIYVVESSPLVLFITYAV